MGCAFSSAGGALRPFEGVRVIHINGYVEDFDVPVTVGQVTGKASSSEEEGQRRQERRYVLCSSAHLLQPGRGPFRPDDPLEAGTVYFLLPQSIFQSESSAVDLACLMNRLTSLARKGAAGSGANGPSPVEALFAGLHHAPPPSSCSSKPPPEHDHRPPAPSSTGPERSCAAASRPAAWKPRLDRIDESIGRSSMRSSSSRSACSTEA
ncbi:hypothetical protein E2562_026195 [Oryza meyeriana var. granulata]|uniref:DUF4228 domain-containing protein n=1 Tax=Oryza meyeriana var. granulata TaxID=110450 RepID=A0A6G1E2V2_9ORYZ|nr:hypothetical protein E2562_026195 [Oryza meyeriana var. granulata]